MDNAQLFSKHNGWSQNITEYVLENFLHLIKWKTSKNTILDIGSGDGLILCETLLPKISEKAEKLFGIDISREMVVFAKKKYGNKRISFEEMDIATDAIPKKYFETFDFIFSSMCLHWVQEQSLAFKNIYKMLKPGGYILITQMGQGSMYEVYEQMAQMEKWKSYMTDYRKFFPPYNHLFNPEQEMRHILEKIGFHVEICRFEDKTYTFPTRHLVYGFLKSINPFLPRIPECNHAEYMEDYFTVLNKLSSVKIERTLNKDEETTFFYQLSIVVALKN